MVFWRKKNNQKDQDREKAEDEIVHHKNDPAIEPSIEYDSDLGGQVKHELTLTEQDILEEMDVVPVPVHNPQSDFQESEDLKDHSAEGGWFSRLTKGLSKSSSKLGQGISDVFTKRKLDADSLQDLEDILIMADMGPKVAANIVAEFSKEKFDKEVDWREVQKSLAGQIQQILTPVAKPLDIEAGSHKPFVVLVCGVNGAGKTTTIGKLAYKYHLQDRKKVMIAAGDTFRAAAVEQLDIWAKRAGVPLLKKEIGTDSAAVAFEAVEKAKAEGMDLLMIDTAGRLQNKKNLMDELEKMIRVIKKHDETAPHAVILVLDATTGQNAHSQLQNFKEVVDVSGLVITKLDGSAKGGVVVSLAQEFGLPIHAVGVGEQIEDLSPFKAEEFAKALMGL